ncbi:MAG: EMC3/TMCO1 family protein [Candidatus Bilamarchaeaceae archaeon]
MDLSFYIYLVAAAAIIYSIIAREVQNRMIDRKEIEDIQKESKRLSKEYKEAAEKSDRARMDKIMSEQMALLPRMNKMMFNQFKPMIIILVIFGLFTYVVNHFDPSTSDDIKLQMKDDGSNCDERAGDGIYTACFNISGANYGKWVAVVRALNGGTEVGRNATFFYYGERTTEAYVDRTNANMEIATDKDVYGEGETVRITAKPPQNAHDVAVVINNGTEFKVELPFTLPMVNVKTIYQPYWWFIFISLIFGLSYSFILGRIKK